ncbi:M24 family metallopeptidase [Phyllobacterium meliloti]|uniref:M24 family metallopeptidase n=1 Tax=Phyllobacterium meliloti TaxID=555317 RepID=UPI001D154D80|nr:Xaa-Pro peptidase family protein [Phyllobacterium sp. T1293]UGX89115.1 Xaa-Pro peptidase family protein [Phyllobacterium sp. T1293]
MSELRMTRLRERMAETGTDLVVVGPSSHMVWLAGLSPHGDERPVLLIVSKDHAGLLMPALNADSSRQHTDLPFYPWTDGEGPDAALAALLKDAGATKPGIKIALDETMRADFALLVIDALPGAKRTFLNDTVGYLRARKDEAEYAALKANALINDGAMRAAFAALKPGVTEQEIAGVVRDFYKANNARPEFTSVCFGENGAFPHHHTGERKLKANEAVLIDIGGRSDGYPSDMTRVAICGDTPEDFDKVHAVLDRAVEAAIAAAKPGVAAKEVDKAARDVITEAGYGEFFLHRTGHGMGIDIHEPPYITATSEAILEDGHVFSIEPGIYLSGKFGLRLEEIVIIRGNRAEVLSELPRTAFKA